MASTLSVAQKIALFDILETPYAGSVDKPTGEFRLSATTHTPNSDSQKLQTKITDRLNSMVTEEETVLIQYISRWQMIGTNVAVVDGSVGGVNGATYSPLSEQGMIQKKVRNLISIMEMHDEITLAKQQGQSSVNLSTTR